MITSVGTVKWFYKENEILINFFNNSFRRIAICGLGIEDQRIMSACSAYLVIEVFLVHDSKGKN